MLSVFRFKCKHSREKNYLTSSLPCPLSLLLPLCIWLECQLLCFHGIIQAEEDSGEEEEDPCGEWDHKGGAATTGNRGWPCGKHAGGGSWRGPAVQLAIGQSLGQYS